MTKKYLTAAEIEAFLGEIVIDDTFIPMSQDSYNETEIMNSIKATSKEDELCMAAINMACVGYGNRRYGNFKHKGTIIDIANLLTNCGVKLGLPKDAKLKDEDLTPQRLCRAFRHNIQKYIVANKFETYLFRKYSSQDPKYLHLMFRGAEYLDDLNPDECAYLMETYATMDEKLNLNISERIKRVFQAKGYLKRVVK
jgi:hypothetical protein